MRWHDEFYRDFFNTILSKSLRRLFQVNLADKPAPLFDVTADGQRLVAVTWARIQLDQFAA